MTNRGGGPTLRMLTGNPIPLFGLGTWQVPEQVNFSWSLAT